MNSRVNRSTGKAPKEVKKQRLFYQFFLQKSDHTIQKTSV